MIDYVGFFWPYFGVGEGLVDFVGFCFHPLSVFPVFSFLGYLADVDLGIEVGGKCFAVVTRIAVYNVEIVYLIEMMFGGIRSKDACHTRVEATSQYGGETSLFEFLPVSPLPLVFKFGFILWFVVSRIEVVDSRFEAGIHDGKILVGQCHVNHQFRFELVEKGYQFRYIVGVHPRCFDLHSSPAFHIFGNGVTFAFGATGQHDIAEYFVILCHFVGNNCSHATGTNDQYFSHVNFYFSMNRLYKYTMNPRIRREIDLKKALEKALKRLTL